MQKVPTTWIVGHVNILSWLQVTYLDVQGDGLVLKVYSELSVSISSAVICILIKTAIFHTKCAETLILIIPQ